MFSSANPTQQPPPVGLPPLKRPVETAVPAPVLPQPTAPVQQGQSLFLPQDAGREAGSVLLQMLQKRDLPQAAPALPKPGTFKTLEDIEAEQQQGGSGLFSGIQQQFASQQQQQQHNASRPPLFQQQQQQQPLPMRDSSRPSSSGADPFSGGSPLHQPSSPIQLTAVGGFGLPPLLQQQPSGRFVQELTIPDDPSLHKLLNLPQHELIHMRDTGHFDQSTLLTLVQMKQQKEAAQHAAALRAAAAGARMPASGGHYPIPISVPISGQQHYGGGLPLAPQQQQHHAPRFPLPAPPTPLSAHYMAQQMANGHMMGTCSGILP